MKLDEPEILEVHELCCAFADAVITNAQCARLKELLKSSEEAREIYFHSVCLSSSLTEYANEMQSDEATLPISPKVGPVRFRSWAVGLLAASACIVIGIFTARFFPYGTAPSKTEMQSDASAAVVARITSAKDCVWAEGRTLDLGAEIQRGQHLELTSGFAEVTFDSGARLVLEGPAHLDADSAWGATLQYGGLKATVPPQAIGFRVHHKSVKVVDLGTEFSIVADSVGDAEVRVLKGSVEVSPVSDAEGGPVVMKENETRRFGEKRKGPRGSFEKLHGSLANPPPLDHWNPPATFVHWSFDEVKDGVFEGKATGLEGAFKIKCNDAVLTDGRWKKGVHFDGRRTMSLHVPPMPQPGSRTVAFWVRVPHDATLADARPMISWPLHHRKTAVQLRVGWNDNPSRGPLGALCSEFVNIQAVGATPLRDGQWHHVAIVILPIDGTGVGVQVTQYLDGRLEGMTVPAAKASNVALTAEPSDTVWLGGRPKRHGERLHFLGDMDELFIVDRALTPVEIVSLMSQNALPNH